MDSILDIVIIEPYYTGSHKFWADALARYSHHQIQILKLKGQHWKWRMQGSAIPMAAQMNKLHKKSDVILCSDMIDLSLFRSLLNRIHADTPVIYYMHENQLTYPYSEYDRDKDQDFHYGFINYKSCLVADQVVFNSEFHKQQFLDALAKLLQRLPDNRSLDTIDTIADKSIVLPIGIEKEKILKSRKANSIVNDIPVLLWNHRWEHDKRPDLFVRLCNILRDSGARFAINFLGKSSSQYQELLKKFRKDFEAQILHWGMVENHESYLKILVQSDVLPVCSEHDFFGISVLEAMYAGNSPILPSGMVYEEHFHRFESEYFYETFDHFVMLTQMAISKREKFNANLIRDYSYEEVVPLYDRNFEKIS